MKRKEWESLKGMLNGGYRNSYLTINYRSNWRGGDGRAHDHRSGKDIQGSFGYISHEGIVLRGHGQPINYKAIRKISIKRDFTSQKDGEAQ